MGRRVRLGWTAVLLTVLVALVPGAPLYSAGAGVAPARVLVRLHRELATRPGYLAALLPPGLGDRVTARLLPSAWAHGLLSLEVDETALSEVLASLTRRPEVASTSVLRPRSFLPDDGGTAEFAASGTCSALEGSGGNELLWALEAIGAGQAWLWSRGRGVAVAVLDTGIKATHPAFAPGQLLPGIDLTAAGTPVGYPPDGHGHGTRVAVMVAGSGAAGAGSWGAAPEAMVLPVKVLDDRGWGYEDDIIAGIYWAVDAGARIINLSLGEPTDAPTEVRRALEYAAGRGVLVVAASGNRAFAASSGVSGADAWRVMQPARVPLAVAVGATDQSGQRWTSSTDGSCYGPELDLVAPGARVPVLDLLVDGGTALVQVTGTSFAAPLVAGALAVLYSHAPDLTPEQAEWLLGSTASDLGLPGFDPEHGYGWLDLAAAVDRLVRLQDEGSTIPPLPAGGCEPANDRPESAPEALPGPQWAGLEKPGDTDYLRLTLEMPHRAWLRVTPDPLTMGQADLVLEVYAADDLDAPRARADREGTGGAEYLQLELEAGVYYLAVSEHHRHWFAGAYVLDVALSGVVTAGVELPARNASGLARVTLVPEAPGLALQEGVVSGPVARFTALPDGGYLLTASAPGHLEARARVEIDSGQVTTLEVLHGRAVAAGTNRVGFLLSYGDVTGDGRIAAADLVTLTRRLGAYMSDGGGEPLDADGDGAVTLNDLAHALAGLAAVPR